MTIRKKLSTEKDTVKQLTKKQIIRDLEAVSKGKAIKGGATMVEYGLLVGIIATVCGPFTAKK